MTSKPTTTANDDDPQLLEYPTGSTVPFPYPTPYPQQIALMDTLLQCLRQKEEQQQQEEQDDDANNSYSNNDTKTKKKQQQLAAVMMLESPTGTGKSLSLACSSMAWLKYREQQDFLVKQQQQKTEEKKEATTTTTTGAADDWWNAWSPPEDEYEKQQQQEEMEKTKQIAMESRSALNMELDILRTKIMYTTSDSSSSLTTTTTSVDIERIQQRRENFLRAAISRAKLAERSGQKRRQQRNKKRKKKATAAGGAAGTSGGAKERLEDFCVKDYNSDPEERYYATNGNDYDDNDSSCCGSESEMTTTTNHGKTRISQYNNNNNNNDNQHLSASQLLDGHRLDGSYRPTNETTTTTTTTTIAHQGLLLGASSSSSSCSKVEPGSGIFRKIVYAARTHSQLSQFVSELKRIPKWGATTRVVALGSRQLLCGNNLLKKSHPTESSLTEACLDLKQGSSSSSNKQNNNNNNKKRKEIGGRNNDNNNNDDDDDGTTKNKSNKKTSSGGGGCCCPLLESKESISTLGLHLLTTPSDIEDAARLGEASRTCAYYATRKALTAAEVVVLPYSMLLSKSTRQAVGLSLKECLVLVDEAHNTPEAIRQLHSSTLSLPVVKAALGQLTRYTQTYAQRLAGRNLMYIGNLRKVLRAFEKHLKEEQQQGSECQKSKRHDKENNPIRSSKMTTTTTATKPKRTLQSTIEFLLDLKIDNINIFKLINYLERSRLSQKLLGFTRAKDGEAEEEDANVVDTGLSKHVSAMSIVQTFLEKLNLQGKEGKIVTDWPTTATAGGTSGDSQVKHPTLRYVLLQPASCFDNILEEAHAVALVGGTLAPFGHVAAELLSSVEKKKKEKEPQQQEQSFLKLAAQADNSFQSQQGLHRSNNSTSNAFVRPRFAAFTCDHVVPSRNVFVKSLSFGPGKRKLDFRHHSRMASALCQDLGQALLRLSRVVPNGLVVFLPSYNYEAHLVKQWQQSGLYDQLNRSKKIFREPKSAQQLDATLRSYAKQAAAGGSAKEEGSHETSGSRGALLLSVIGGKMSEGINLSNSMARGVVVVGLPYPDYTDPVLQEKMTTMDNHGEGGISGRAYYQNLCMRAVNQSVGRAIRHANDYAAIFLADYRYAAQPNTWAALPKWLRNAASSPHSDEGFPALSSDLQVFFSAKEPKEPK